ncbi:membrane protein insertase YidC, partial [Gemmatimonadota bacterium]
MEDKRSIIALVVIGAILLLTPTYMKLINPPGEPATTDSLMVAAPGPQEQDIPASGPEAFIPPMPSAPERLESEVIAVADTSAAFDGISIDTPLFTATIGLEGAALRGWTLKGYEREGSPPVDMIPDDAMGAVMELPIEDRQFLASSLEFSTDAPDTTTVPAGEELTITLTARVDDTRSVTRTLTFNGSAYHFNITDTFYGFETSPVNDTYRLMWLGGLAFSEATPQEHEAIRQEYETTRNQQELTRNENAFNKKLREDWTYSGYFAFQGGDAERTKLKARDPVTAQSFGTVDWVALRVKYFAAIIMPVGEPFRGAQMTGRAGVVGPALMSVATDRRLPAGEGSEISTDLYLGPIDYRILQGYDRNLDKIMDFGFSIIKPISRLVLTLFTWLHTFIPNYGIVIIIFSILVKIVVFPLTRKSYQSMHAMQELSPKMAEIREKYKDDQEKMNKKIMSLYKENKVNPLGGCFPLLLQMPIFWGLFIVFRTTIELRGEPFMLWITDLSLNDPYMVLPGLMAISMLIQQRAQLKDPKQRPMALMMPAILFFVFRSFPAGLILYWTLFNILSLLQTEFMSGKKEP